MGISRFSRKKKVPAFLGPWPRGTFGSLALAAASILPSASLDGIGVPDDLISRLGVPAATMPKPAVGESEA
jgi:hypothetical protein